MILIKIQIRCKFTFLDAISHFLTQQVKYLSKPIEIMFIEWLPRKVYNSLFVRGNYCHLFLEVWPYGLFCQLDTQSRVWKKKEEIYKNARIIT